MLRDGAEVSSTLISLFCSMIRVILSIRGQNKSCSKSYAKTERSGNVMQRGGFFQEVAMA
ncbi:hypothetical protein CO668_29560 [Rhizobium anhuiense]|nr:hypothetical protein CO668_29560 [Rhizobium anhuiense]